MAQDNDVANGAAKAARGGERASACRPPTSKEGSLARNAPAGGEQKRLQELQKTLATRLRRPRGTSLCLSLLWTGPISGLFFSRLRRRNITVRMPRVKDDWGTALATNDRCGSAAPQCGKALPYRRFA